MCRRSPQVASTLKAMSAAGFSPRLPTCSLQSCGASADLWKLSEGGGEAEFVWICAWLPEKLAKSEARWPWMGSPPSLGSWLPPPLPSVPSSFFLAPFWYIKSHFKLLKYSLNPSSHDLRVVIRNSKTTNYPVSIQILKFLRPFTT